MSPDEHLRRLLLSETDRVEWKESTRQSDEILHAVCALANDLGNSRQPGYLLIGVSKSGAVVGVDEQRKDELQQQLASRLRSSKIQPVPSASVTDHEWQDRTILVVEVEPYPVPPVVEVDARAWVRIGTSTQKANHADLLRLNERRPWNRTPFDTRPLAGTSIDDLEVRSLRAAHASEQAMDDHSESFPSFESWLAQRQLGTILQIGFVPNATAILLFGKSPQDSLPGAWIDCVRYPGIDRDGVPISRRPLTGALRDQLDVGWTWLAAQNEDRPAADNGIQLAFRPDYPEEALKELLRNMVQHRQYEGTNAPGRIEWFTDRIEFSNPGGPFGRAAEGDFGTNSDYRNPLLTSRLVAEGYVQQLGRGVRRARTQLEKNGNPPLEVETDGFTRVIVRRRS
ncbi:MAG: putative DNA binding domain-containing protein [Planctomycetes bacterium]|nr:putative DNA binding domain-containing protein [Planctomycetota bacterium]